MTLKNRLDEGAFVLLAEMEPPKGVDTAPMLANALRVRERVDAFVVPEMSNAVMRMSSLGASMILQARGLETVMQVNCRDRNRLALQADLLAANGCGINSVMAVDGQEPGFGDHHQARSVYDVDLIGLLSAIDGLQRGRDMAGIELAGAPRLLVGSTTEAGAAGKSPELEAEEIHKKQEAGVRFLITPPLFDPALLTPFMHRIGTRVAVLPTVLLLKSLGMARYMARNMAHIHIPDEVVARIQDAPDKVRECVQIAADTLVAFKKEGFPGAVIATLGWEHRLPEILDRM